MNGTNCVGDIGLIQEIEEIFSVASDPVRLTQLTSLSIEGLDLTMINLT